MFRPEVAGSALSPSMTSRLERRVRLAASATAASSSTMHRVCLEWVRDDTQRSIEHKSNEEFQLEEEKQTRGRDETFAGLGNLARARVAQSDTKAALSSFSSAAASLLLSRYVLHLQSTRCSGIPFAKCLRFSPAARVSGI